MSYSLEVKKNRKKREDLSKKHLLFWASPSLLLYTQFEQLVKLFPKAKCCFLVLYRTQ